MWGGTRSLGRRGKKRGCAISGKVNGEMIKKIKLIKEEVYIYINKEKNRIIATHYFNPQKQLFCFFKQL